METWFGPITFALNFLSGEISDMEQISYTIINTQSSPLD